ncbi:MAG: FkbM family methyltransferase [Gemmataceae bacterium]|nr:FkbM family methyltransferase [Gemmataceae bacterium]
MNDMYVGQSLHHYGEFSQGEVNVFDQIVQEGDVVVEAGAHMGAHSLFLAKKVGPRGLLLAFEPQRLQFQLLCANMALNSIIGAICQQAALGAERGSLIVPVADPTRVANFGGLKIEGHESGDPVPLLQLDSFPLQRCKLLKVDVEGMEKQVLEGAKGIIQRHWPALYVENDRRDKSEALIRFIDALGYDMYWHRPPLFNPENFANNPVNIFADLVSANLLCLPKHAAQNMTGFRKVLLPA